MGVLGQQSERKKIIVPEMRGAEDRQAPPRPPGAAVMRASKMTSVNARSAAHYRGDCTEPDRPRKLHRGDTIRVVAPARSRQFVAEHDHSRRDRCPLCRPGAAATFAEHIDERDDFESSPVASRVSDLHAAFADPQVAASSP